MGSKSLKLIVISDLHCHYSKNGKDQTYLTSDMLRSPINNHPVESLLNLIEKQTEDLKVDLTICPGDFTNKCDQQGFVSAWNYVKEINEAVGGKEIIATLGNHDVDSYQAISNYNLTIAKGIKRDFPLRDDVTRDQFWSKGCVFIEEKDYRILVINSSHFHFNAQNASTGEVDDNLLDFIEEYLRVQDKNKIQIALAHHHPIDHSRGDLGEEDTIVKGGELLNILCKYEFDLFIHGHKHDAFLRNYDLSETSYKLPILSSGSFSATTNLSWTSKRNHFHKIEINKDIGKNAKGIIKTWTFMAKRGWNFTYDEEAFPPQTGFGFNGNIEELAAKIEQELEGNAMMEYEDIIAKIPDVKHLIPQEGKKLERLLRQKKIAFHPSLANAECIFKKNY